MATCSTTVQIHTSYDSANRLSSLTQGTDTFTYAYNGLGDRYQQSLNAITTTYQLDLNAGLTQVLADGAKTYLYGLSRLAEDDGTDWAYYLPDALGSVRQLADTNAEIVRASSFEPFGDVLNTDGTASTSYGFAGEWLDNTGQIPKPLNTISLKITNMAKMCRAISRVVFFALSIL